VGWFAKTLADPTVRFQLYQGRNSPCETIE
jgi:hypothetical protein